MFSHKPRILVVCSRNKRRSLTAETLFRNSLEAEVRSAGTSPRARHTVSIKDIAWADVIICMERKHHQQLARLFKQDQLPSIRVADIEDIYEYMDPELCSLLKSTIREYFRF